VRGGINIQYESARVKWRGVSYRLHYFNNHFFMGTRSSTRFFGFYWWEGIRSFFWPISSECHSFEEGGLLFTETWLWGMKAMTLVCFTKGYWIWRLHSFWPGGATYHSHSHYKFGHTPPLGLFLLLGYGVGVFSFYNTRGWECCLLPMAFLG